MNNRSLTRGDLIVIGAAVLLLIASFLDFYAVDAPDGTPSDAIPSLGNGWSNKNWPVLQAIFLSGLFSAGAQVASRFLPKELNILGLRLDQWAVPLGVMPLFVTIWMVIRSTNTLMDGATIGAGLWITIPAVLALNAGLILPQFVPALALPISGGPAAPQGPYGGQPQQGYGYPGAQQPGMQQPGMQQPQGGYGYPAAQQQPGAQQPYSQQQPQAQQPQPAAQQQPQPQAGGAPDPNFQPFWFAVPVARPLFAEDGSQTPVAELAPGTWYLAVEQRGQALVAQTQDNRRGILQDTSGIQRG